VERKLYEPLGYRGLGDYAREHLGVGARTVREWARVWKKLAELPLLRAALLSGEISWAVARLVVGLATPETDAACVETVRGRTVRAVEALLRARLTNGVALLFSTHDEQLAGRLGDRKLRVSHGLVTAEAP
jgi:hypothetical protein